MKFIFSWKRYAPPCNIHHLLNQKMVLIMDKMQKLKGCWSYVQIKKMMFNICSNDRKNTIYFMKILSVWVQFQIGKYFKTYCSVVVLNKGNFKCFYYISDYRKMQYQGYYYQYKVQYKIVKKNYQIYQNEQELFIEFKKYT